MMVENRRRTQKIQDSLSGIEGDSLQNGLASISAPGSASPSDDPADTLMEEDSSSSILEAVTQIENSMNTRFDNLETSLTGVKTAQAPNSSRITSLEETREEHDMCVTELEKSCDELCT